MFTIQTHHSDCEHTLSVRLSLHSPLILLVFFFISRRLYLLYVSCFIVFVFFFLFTHFRLLWFYMGYIIANGTIYHQSENGPSNRRANTIRFSNRKITSNSLYEEKKERNNLDFVRNCARPVKNDVTRVITRSMRLFVVFVVCFVHSLSVPFYLFCVILVG